MPRDVAVIVPWRGGCPHRAQALTRVTDHLVATHPRWPVILGEVDPGAPWVKAQAVAAALESTDAELLVVHDADVWTDGLAAAVDALTDAAWAIPHGFLYRLAEGQLEPTTDKQHLAQAPYRGHAGGGIVVINRSTYERCSLDARFVGFGQEDDAWALALTTLVGPAWRGDAPLWHLWHPPQPRMTRARGNRDGWKLYQQYRRCRGKPEAMAELVDAGRAHG